MGTSSSYKAPSSGSWPNAKRIMTQFARSDGATGAGGVVAAAVSAMGGPRGATSNASSGRRAAQRLGHVLSGIARQGLDATLQRIGLENLVGKSKNEVINGIVDYIVGDGALIEDAIARNALLSLFANLEEQSEEIIENPSEFLENIVNLEGVWDLVIAYVVEYIYWQIVQVLGEKLVKNSRSERTAIQLQRDIYDDIKLRVRSRFRVELRQGELNWQGNQIKGLLTELFERAYACWSVM